MTRQTFLFARRSAGTSKAHTLLPVVLSGIVRIYRTCDFYGASQHSKHWQTGLEFLPTQDIFADSCHPTRSLRAPVAVFAARRT